MSENVDVPVQVVLQPCHLEKIVTVLMVAGDPESQNIAKALLVLLRRSDKAKPAGCATYGDIVLNWRSKYHPHNIEPARH